MPEKKNEKSGKRDDWLQVDGRGTHQEQWLILKLHINLFCRHKSGLDLSVKVVPRIEK